MRLIDLDKVYESACAGCTRHGDAPGECYHDEPCERLIFAFTTAEPVEAVVLPCNVGSTVYETDGIRIYPHQIKKLIFDAGHIAFDESAIGTSIFLTREAAEVALVKMKGGA